MPVMTTRFTLWTRSKKWRRRTAHLRQFLLTLAGSLLAVASLAVVVWLAARVPVWRDQVAGIHDVKDRISLENEITKNVVQLLGGSILLLGLYFTWKNTRLAQEGQLTDRFNQAIEHLGDDKSEVRLGGIYALARIAADSPRDHWSVMQVFCTYIRTKATGPAGSVPVEVATILTLLGRRRVDYELDDETLDLRGTNLSGLNLNGSQFDGTLFDGAALENTQFMDAHLRGASFRGADLQGAYLRRADLTHADLTGADVRAATFRDAALVHANLFGARMEGASLIGCNLHAARNAVKSQIAAALTDEATVLPSYQDVSGAEE